MSKPTAKRQLRLNNRPAVRSSLGRILRDLDALPEPSGAEIQKVRLLIYGVATMAQIDKSADLDEAHRRLDELEKRISEYEAAT